MPVTHTRRGGKWRVVEASTRRLAKNDGNAVDGGGHTSEAKAKAQARAVNSKKRPVTYEMDRKECKQARTPGASSAKSATARFVASRSGSKRY